MENQITTEILNALLDDLTSAVQTRQASGEIHLIANNKKVARIREEILWAFKWGYEIPEIPTDPSLNRL